jgi:hypothetical protein
MILSISLRCITSVYARSQSRGHQFALYNQTHCSSLSIDSSQNRATITCMIAIIAASLAWITDNCHELDCAKPPKTLSTTNRLMHFIIDCCTTIRDAARAPSLTIARVTI